MKFAIPLTDKELTARFGHCQKIALIDVEDNQIKQKGILKPTVHEPAVCSKVLNVLDADIIISSCMANSALILFDQQGIKVITGAPELEPEELVKRYLNNTLVAGDNLCNHKPEFLMKNLSGFSAIFYI